MDLHQYVRVLRRGWLLLTLSAVVCLGGAAALAALLPATYQSESQVYVSVDNAADASDLSESTIYSQEIVRSFVELTTSSSVLQPVIEDLGLSETSAELADRIEVAAQTGTVILEIAVSDEDPAQAAAIAGAVTESLGGVVQDLTPEAADGGARIALTTVEEPTVAQNPEWPDPVILLGLGLVAGLALGVAILALREVLDTRVRNEGDLGEFGDLPVLGSVPENKQLRRGVLAARTERGTALSESFSRLRTNLQFLDVGSPSRSFVVTSSVQGEGKSTVAVNLAISLRNAGHRVLLVDADLRRPEVADLLGLEGAVGLTDLLTGQVTASDVIQLWGPRRLAVLPSGTVPPNPNELLGSVAMRELVKELHRDYDTVLFDAPPLLPVSDATVLSGLCSGALVVVGVGKVHQPQLRRAVESLQMLEVRLFGLVPTMVPVRGADADSYSRQSAVGRYTADADRQ